jgi:hypothetical protein
MKELTQQLKDGKMQGIMRFRPYPDDPRRPSCLILGFAKESRPLHILCGKLEEDEILIVTAYEPDPEEWEADWRTRKRGV